MHGEKHSDSVASKAELAVKSNERAQLGVSGFEASLLVELFQLTEDARLQRLHRIHQESPELGRKLDELLKFDPLIAHDFGACTSLRMLDTTRVDSQSNLHDRSSNDLPRDAARQTDQPADATTKIETQPLSSDASEGVPASGSWPARNDCTELTLGRMLGSGGMGQVYAGTENGRSVAVKYLANGFRVSKTYSARFRREHRALSNLVHPNIVEVYSIAEDGSYFTMELVDGPNLQAWRHAQAEPPTFRDIARLVAQLAAAVEYANRQGIVHRDLKPRNVIITRTESGELIPKLVDFGIASVAGATQLTATGEAIGSVNYLAPENLIGVHEYQQSTSVDVYGLGGLLYFLITGRAPFDDQASSAHELLHLLRDPHSVPREPVNENHRSDSQLTTICLRCLAKSPEDRYASAGDVAADLERYLRSESIVAVRDPWQKQLGRTVRRNSRALALATVSMVIAIAMWGLWLQARQERTAAYKTVQSLLGVLDSQASVLASSEMLSSPDNHVLCEALFDGFRVSHSQLNMQRLSDQDLYMHGQQLIRIAGVASEIGQLDVAKEFIDWFEQLDREISANRRGHNLLDGLHWPTLRAKADLTKAIVLTADDQTEAAIEVAERAAQRLDQDRAGPHSGSELERIQADLLRVASEACYLHYRRGPEMVRGLRYSVAEYQLRAKLHQESKSDTDLLYLAKAIGRIGLSLYKGAILVEETKELLASTPYTNDYESVLESALATMAGVEHRESTEAILTRCSIANMLGLALTRKNNERAIALHQENVEAYQSLQLRFPLALNYRVGLARSYGNLGYAYDVAENWSEALEAERACFDQYCQIFDQYGSQRDVIADICVHGVNLFGLAMYECGQMKFAEQAAFQTLSRCQLNSVVYSEDVNSVRAAAMLAYAISSNIKRVPAQQTIWESDLDMALSRALRPTHMASQDQREMVYDYFSQTPSLLSLRPEIGKVVQDIKTDRQHARK